VTTGGVRRITGIQRRVDLHALACAEGGFRFENTIFEDAVFLGAFSSEVVVFKKCSGSLNFDGGGPISLRFDDCHFDHLCLQAELEVRELTMRNTRAEHSAMRNIRICHLDMKEVDLPNLLSRHVRFPKRGRLDWPAFIRLWLSPKAVANGNTVRLPGAERSPFVDFLRLEYKLDLILKEAEPPDGKARPLVDLPRRLSVTLVPFVLLVTTKLGTSLTRLIFTTLASLIGGTALVAMSTGATVGRSVETVVALLLSRDSPIAGLHPTIELGLSAIGLLLFALLIAVISNRFLNS
jgi:hypothetical protein